MSKKTFSSAPKPKQLTDDQIQAFERSGAGHDTPKTKPALKQTKQSKRLSLDLPVSLHRRFKTACSATGNKMAGELLDLIEQRTDELENEAGINLK